MSDFSVLDMAADYASQNDVDPKEIFMQHPVSGNVKNEAEAAAVDTMDEPIDDPQAAVVPQVPVPQKRRDWVPDPSVMNDLPELQGTGAVYEADEVKLERDTTLHNIADDNAIQESREAMNELTRKGVNIEDAKRRHGIRKFQIPEGQYHVAIFAAAGDTNYQRGQAELDKIFAEIIKVHPEFILEWEPGRAPNQVLGEAPALQENTGKIAEFPTLTESDNPEEVATPAGDGDNLFANTMPQNHSMMADEKGSMGPDAKVIIDKRQATEVSWSAEEVDKIKRSRTVELNIVETANLEFSSIEDVPDNAVDSVLESYQRKTGEIVAALPCSKYRATFIGLSMTEVIDLSSASDMNDYDGEMKKWSICFDHIRNPSIGAWEEYTWYIDPNTNTKVKINYKEAGPEDVETHDVSKFEDFMRKTSFLDLEFMLWKILCATAMDKEIISIDCHARHDGVECGNNYDWIYSPADLLDMNTINPAVLEEMKATGEASNMEDIMKNYASSPVNSKDTVKLNGCGFMPVYGHVSGYDYLQGGIYAEIKKLEDAEENDPTIASRGLSWTTLTVIKAFLIPTENGGAKRIVGPKNLAKVIQTLDEVDWQTISEITRLMLEPYQFKFALRDIVCPKCKNRSSIAIDSMSRLLFIVARSLSSVQVTLKKT